MKWNTPEVTLAGYIQAEFVRVGKSDGGRFYG
jgi:hypothetical protein